MTRFANRARIGLAVGVLAIGLGTPAAAAAQSTGDVVISGSSGSVTIPSPPTTERPQVAGFVTTNESLTFGDTTVSTSRSSGLALTGYDIAGLTVIGAAAVGTGVILLKVRRRTAN